MPTAFAMDFSLFRIAKQLRLLGYDALCDRALSHDAVVRRAQHEGRLLITGSSKLVPHLDKLNADAAAAPAASGHSRVVIGYNSDGESEYAESDDEATSDASTRGISYVLVNTNRSFDEQFKDVVRKANVQWRPHCIFTRCVACNILIEEVPDKATVQHLVNPSVFAVYAHFYQCRECKKVYWGLDNGIVVNYKALRTVENLKRFCVPASDREAGMIARHLMSFPRKVKIAIFSFSTPAELGNLRIAFPALSGLLTAIERGESTKFVPDYKRNKFTPS